VRTGAAHADLPRARLRGPAGGCGYWLAPHLWFVAGLTRDEVAGGEDEPSFLTEIVGPPYAEVFSRPVRRYLYRVLKALQVREGGSLTLLPNDKGFQLTAEDAEFQQQLQEARSLMARYSQTLRELAK